jgi:hypothetical protein
LIYLEPAEAEQLLQTAAAAAAAGTSAAAVAIYEQTRPDDAFGVTMVGNLEVSGGQLGPAAAAAAAAAAAETAGAE